MKLSKNRAWRPTPAIARLPKAELYPEDEPDYRTAFQRDRDRILHTTAFRRLEYKTQVFINYEGDYYRTRLTHTLEVAQIGRTIARALGANEDLVEGICLAHDLGHSAFGHSGEVALARLMKDYGGFDHNKQSLRIVTMLERRYPDFPGLNLTWEVREGIVKHESEYDIADASRVQPRPARPSGSADRQCGRRAGLYRPRPGRRPALGHDHARHAGRHHPVGDPGGERWPARSRCWMTWPATA